MKAQDLRIGNIVFYDDTPVTVYAVLQDGINLTEGDFTECKLERLKGIPLTQDVFQKCELSSSFPLVTTWGEIRGVRIGQVRYHYPIDEDHIRCIDYLHELQNIYYSVMENELTVNL